LHDLEKNAIFADAGRVKFALALVVILIGDCAAAQTVPLPHPRPAEHPTAQPPSAAASDDLQRARNAPTACQLRLTPDLAAFQPLGEISGPGECGGRDIVSLQRVVAKNGAQIEISPPATLRCETAEAIVTWVREDLARAAALGPGLAAIENFDSFECRGQNRVPGAKLSEHGKANALDIRSFRLKNGQVVQPTDPAAPKEFRLAMKTSACARFMTVLGPGSDGYHEDHIHVDLAERRGGYRICHWELYEGAPATDYALQSAHVVPLPRPRPFEGPGTAFPANPRPAERRP
jgi:hypothetical protein